MPNHCVSPDSGDNALGPTSNLLINQSLARAVAPAPHAARCGAGAREDRCPGPRETQRRTGAVARHPGWAFGPDGHGAGMLWACSSRSESIYLERDQVLGWPRYQGISELRLNWNGDHAIGHSQILGKALKTSFRHILALVTVSRLIHYSDNLCNYVKHVFFALA